MPASRIRVPFANLHEQYLSIKPEIDSAIADVIAKSAFVRGPYVDKFEEEFAAAIGVSRCVSCANGTDALYIAMRSLDVRPGDEIIVPAMSWISTSETVTQAGGRVVFCDIDPVTYTLDPKMVEEKITSRTVGIIPVHLYGHPAEMDLLLHVANKHGLWVLEDCAQAHLAEFNRQRVGTFGVAGTFSFYPGKNLGAMGDAGAIVTDDNALADRMAKFARHGGLRKGDHEIEGINSRLDGLQAAILAVKLKHLSRWTDNRRGIAGAYSKMLSHIAGIRLPSEAEWATHVWHLYVIQSDNRDDITQDLRAKGVQAAVYYPCALPFLPCYSYLNSSAEDFPVSQALARNGLSLPIFAEMTESESRYVVQMLVGDS